MRDQRNLHRPPGSKEAEEALSSYVSARTLALLFFHPSGGVSIGSATAIRLGDSYLLATAAHNLSNLDKEATIEVSPHRATSAKKIEIVSRSHPRDSDDLHDVGWIQVSADSAKDSGIPWLDISDLLCGQRFDPGEAFLVQGYPASLVVVRNSRTFNLLSLGVGCVPLPTDQEEDFLALEYPPQSPEDAGLELPSPEGLSDGGGVWTFASFRDSPIWLPESARLVAVCSSHEPPRARLRTTPIEHWLSLVAVDFPDLKTLVATHLESSLARPGVLISPNFDHRKLRSPRIDDLIDVLEDRIRFWTLEPAKRLASNALDQVAAMNLLLSYFEGIWIYVQGRDSKSRSREFFESAFVDVFRRGGLNEHLLRRIAGVFYEDARCGFFHDGMFRERIFFGKPRGGALHVTLPLRDGVLDEGGEIQSILVNVEEFYLYVEGHFREFVARLRDPQQEQLRSGLLAICRQKWGYEGEGRILLP